MDEQRPIIVYGTAVYGKILYYGLCQQGKQVVGFADKFPKESYMGKPVLDLAGLQAYVKKEHPIVLLAVTKSLKTVVKQLEEMHITEYYSAIDVMDKTILPEQESEQQVVNSYKMRWQYEYSIKEYNAFEQLYVPSLDVVVSERCSLRCKDCSNLMQYYHYPVNLDIVVVHETLERFLSQIDYLGELRILGGEPFMCPEFTKLITWYANDPRIMRIGIYSNATIFPKEEMLHAFKADKIVMHFSDYGVLSRNLEKWIAYCDENGISCVVTKMDQWHDCGRLEKRNYSEEAKVRVYQTCECKDLPTLLHGYLYNCPYAAHAANLGAMDASERRRDCLSFDSPDDVYTAEELRTFLFGKTHLEACDYCSGRNYSLKAIPPFVQAKEPLPYERKDV